MRRHIPLLATGLTAALLSLAACTSDGGGDADAAKSPGPRVVAPGKPGEDARTLSADEAVKARPDNRPNAADILYVQDMIKHHEQAVEMTELAGEHGEAKDVRGIADRIHDTQGPEIESMRAWLKRNGQPQEPKGGHDHAAMPGMATADRLKELGEARGAAFDRLFLELMIAHHDGALTMATDVLSEGNDVIVEEMANDVISSQTAEIDRMRGMM